MTYRAVIDILNNQQQLNNNEKFVRYMYYIPEIDFFYSFRLILGTKKQLPLQKNMNMGVPEM